jgi:hypothetical protein
MANWKEILEALKDAADGTDTEAEVAFEILCACFGAKAKADFIAKLAIVESVVEAAGGFLPGDPRVAEAKEWVEGGLAILRGEE